MKSKGISPSEFYRDTIKVIVNADQDIPEDMKDTFINKAYSILQLAMMQTYDARKVKMVIEED